MKKIFTLLALPLFAVVAKAQTTSVTYAVSEGETFTSGQVVNVKSDGATVATLTYGVDGGNVFTAPKKDDQRIPGFWGYTEGNGVNGAPDSGTVYFIKPFYDGTVEVGVVLNADKKFYILENGNALSDYNGITVSPKYQGTYKFNVVADAVYSIYCAGSKLGFYGFKYQFELPNNSNGAPISWSASNVEFKVRDNISSIVLPTLSNEENLDVTYASSNPDIASIDANGKVTLQNETVGSTTISATYSGDKYDETVVEYEINVVTNIVDAYAWAIDEDPNFEFDYLWSSPTSTIAAETKLIDDENIIVSTVSSAKASSSYKGTFFGITFNGSAQLGRVDPAPSEDALTGTPVSDNSPLVVEALTDLQLVMIYRKQALEVEVVESDNVADNVITATHYWGSTPNDSKSLYAVNQDAITEKLDQTIYNGGPNDGKSAAASSGNYITAASCWNLKSGQTYTIWCKGTTASVNGIGYILPSEPDTEAVKGLDVDANAPVEFFNLQGVRVANPENGIFIRRQGNNVSKVLVK